MAATLVECLHIMTGEYAELLSATDPDQLVVAAKCETKGTEKADAK